MNLSNMMANLTNKKEPEINNPQPVVKNVVISEVTLIDLPEEGETFRSEKLSNTNTS